MKLLQTLRTIRREDGFAVPAATMMLFAATGIVTVGVISSIRTQSGTTRDHQTKSALPQAEAGVNQALLHFNRIQPGANLCSPVTASGPDASGWCGPATGGFDGGNFSYVARPAADGGLEVVSTGTYSEVSRRVAVRAHSSSGQQVFSDATVLSQEGIQMDSNSEVISNVATNGDIALSANAKICGAAKVGVGRELTTSSNAQHYGDPSCTLAGSAGESELVLPPVNQGDAPANNDNGRFFALDPVSGKKQNVCWDGVRADGAGGSCGERELDVAVNSAVTLGGGKYSFCKLSLSSNSALYVQSGASVIIYFDSPESCGYPSGSVQLELASNSRITATSGGPTNVALLFVGSTSRETRILLNSNTSIDGSCEQNLVIYAPRSDIVLNSNSTYCGAVAGKTIELDSNARLYMDGGSSAFTLPNTSPHYVVDRFVECSTAPPAGGPDAGC